MSIVGQCLSKLLQRLFTAAAERLVDFAHQLEGGEARFERLTAGLNIPH